MKPRPPARPRRVVPFPVLRPLAVALVLAPGASLAQTPGDFHYADYPQRDQFSWRAVASELATSFPRGGSPVVVEPFLQDERTIFSLDDLGLADAVSLRGGDGGVVVVETSDRMVIVGPGGEIVSAQDKADALDSAPPSVVRFGGFDYDVRDGALVRIGPAGPSRVLEFGRDGLPDDEVRAIAASPAREGAPSELYVATAGGIGVLSAEGENAGKWRHLTGRQGGLPIDDATALSFAPDGTLWVGTKFGAARRKTDGDWDYRAGPRWMIGDEVLDVAAFGEQGAAWILTDKSLTLLQPIRMTLREKARILDEITQKRHVRHGAVTGCSFRDPKNLDSWYMTDNDNDGLWTSIYTGAKVFEYAATKDPEALRIAKRHFDFLHRLGTISGIPGFMARSIRPSKYEPGGHEEYHYGGEGEWHESTVEPGWQWKADTSSDELSGHFFLWGVYYDLIAKGDAAEEKRVQDLVRAVTNHLIDNDFTFRDVDGKPTRWAIYSPRLMNGDIFWSDQTMFNPLGILAHLKVAIHVCGDEKFKTAYRELIDEHHYAVKAMYAKEMLPNNPNAGINHSDDEMAWLEYYHLLTYPDEDPWLTWRYKYSAARSMRPEGPEKSPFFIMPFATTFPEWAHVGDAVDTLREWPLDLREFRVVNSRRDDVQLDPRPVHRDDRPRLLVPVGFDERPPEKWNHDPYVADMGNDGRSEEDGGSWLLPYWMGVYHGFIVER